MSTVISAERDRPRWPGRVAGWLRGNSNSRAWLRRKAVAAWMNLLIMAAAAVTVVAGGPHWPAPQARGGDALKLFTLWCLAFMPGWLYVRFLDLRARALWNEYVLSLHRLGWDTPCNLPEPPTASVFYARWRQGPHGPADDNIYQQKFEAYYGRQITKTPKTETDAGSRLSTESLFPVFLATAVLAAGWAAVLWNTAFVTHPDGPWDVLKYAFLGAYAFVTSMLIRRFFQSDLRPSAYATVVFRITLVLLIVVILHQVIGQVGHAELAVAFVVGFFPLIGLQALQRLTSKVLGQFVPPVTSEYPLDQLDGLNLWYEARLTEEGVEDMQNLTTMNLVDVILHTRVPPGRLVDWIDQAFLLLHLEPASGAQARLELRRAGIRTATDLLKAFSADHGQDGRPDLKPPIPVDQLRLLVWVLAAEPGLNPVWNWQRNGVQVCPQRTEPTEPARPAVPAQPARTAESRSLHAPAA